MVNIFSYVKWIFCWEKFVATGELICNLYAETPKYFVYDTYGYRNC